MEVYYCWITALTASYQDAIITGLVKKGYMVGALDAKGVTIAPGKKSSALIALRIYHTKNTLNVSKVYDNVGDICTEINALCHSIIITKAIDCIWYGGNFNIIDSPKPVSGSKKTMN